jgi:hypothetical protein
MKFSICIFSLLISFNIIFAENDYQLFHKDSETAEKFNIIVLDSTEYSKSDLKGKVRIALTWNDKNGKNLLFLTETGAFQGDSEDSKSAELFLYHYKFEDDQFLLLRRIYDFINDCTFDIYVGFLDSSLTITDLDKDEIAEITILYKLTCRSDVNPSNMKLIMLEDGQKYALRGIMINEYVKHLPPDERTKGIQDYGWGTYTIDKAFDNAPNIFLDFSKKRWEVLKDKDRFVQMYLK